MIVTLRHGGRLPLWAEVLWMAEQWGVPPWEFAGGTVWEWVFRWRKWTEQRIKAGK